MVSHKLHNNLFSVIQIQFHSSNNTLCLLICQVPAVPGVQDTKGVHGTGTNREHLARCAGTFAVNVVQLSTL